MEKPVIDVDELLFKVKLDHLVRSQRPDTYPKDLRLRNIMVIGKLEQCIEVMATVRSGVAQAVIEEGKKLGVI